MRVDELTARELPVRCAWCGYYRRGESWRRDPSIDDRRATHGICPDCFRLLVAHLGAARSRGG